MEAKKYDILEQKMCKEIELIENKYANNAAEMTVQDLEKLDKLYHTLKSKATYDAMKEAEEYGGYEEGMSGRRGRGRSSYDSGRYMSRESGNRYDDGYSGHYPYPPYMSGYPRY